MYKYIFFLSCLFFTARAGAQVSDYTKGYDEKTDESKKLLYNYTYGSFFFSTVVSNVLAFNSVSYFANGRQQFGLGAGVSVHNIRSDSGNVKFISVPVFLANKFYLIENQTKGGLYLDILAGFNLPVSADWVSGAHSGDPVDAQKVRSTGLYGFALGWRFTGKKEYREINYIIELGYRNQHVPYEPDNKKQASDFMGINLGISF